MGLYMIELRKINCEEDLVRCISLYAPMNDNAFLPVDVNTSFINLKDAWDRGFFLRAIYDDNELHGFILAHVTNLIHVKSKILQQLYYVSDFTGFKAARALILSHEAMINYAKKLNIKYVMSSASHMDDNLSLCKILQKKGWDVRGHIALYKL